MLNWKYVVPCVLMIAGVAEGNPMDEGVFEDFEGIAPNTAVGEVIDLGGAELSGKSFAGVVGQGALYHSGVRSWMVLEDGVGAIDFGDVNAGSVGFYLRTHPSADGDTVVTAYDDLGEVVGDIVTVVGGSFDVSDPSGKGFTFIKYTGDIDRIEIENFASNRMNGIDDLGFSLVPEPSSILLLGFGALGVIKRRK